MHTYMRVHAYACVCIAHAGGPKHTRPCYAHPLEPRPPRTPAERKTPALRSAQVLAQIAEIIRSAAVALHDELAEAEADRLLHEAVEAERRANRDRLAETEAVSSSSEASRAHEEQQRRVAEIVEIGKEMDTVKQERASALEAAEARKAAATEAVMRADTAHAHRPSAATEAALLSAKEEERKAIAELAVQHDTWAARVEELERRLAAAEVAAAEAKAAAAAAAAAAGPSGSPTAKEMSAEERNEQFKKAGAFTLYTDCASPSCPNPLSPPTPSPRLALSHHGGSCDPSTPASLSCWNFPAARPPHCSAQRAPSPRAHVRALAQVVHDGRLGLLGWVGEADGQADGPDGEVVVLIDRA